MADAYSYIKPQRLSPKVPPNQRNPNELYTHFMFKSVIILIFLVILLPLFHSQTPEFINQTRTWELLQLILVGIAVSYGLFSRKNNETEKEHNSKFDNVNSYLSRFLQFSSFFEEEMDDTSGSDESYKVQTWSSQYLTRDSLVVLAQENPVFQEQIGNASKIGEKPLFLPVRSLKSRVTKTDYVETVKDVKYNDAPLTETIYESSCTCGSLRTSRSNLGSNPLSRKFNKSRNGEFGGMDPLDIEVLVEEKTALPSPIPWKSRSGRMEMERKEEIDSLPLYSPPFALLESKPKNVEERPRKKIYYESSPPAPPPRPPLVVQNPPVTKSNSTLANEEFSSIKGLKRSNRSVPMDVGGINGEKSLKGVNLGKSVRTIRLCDSVSGTLKTREFDEGNEKNLINERRGRLTTFDYRDYEKGHKQELEEKVVDETDEESESKHGVFGSSENEDVASKNVNDEGPDVDKKADEFIARFREQIRLQRIDSIKRSTGQIAQNSLR